MTENSIGDQPGGQDPACSAHPGSPQNACSECLDEVFAKLASLTDRYRVLMDESAENYRIARDAGKRGEIVPLNDDDGTRGTAAAPQGFRAVHDVTYLEITGRHRPAAEDKLVLAIGHRTTGNPRAVLLERSQVEALYDWLGEWIANGWPGVPRRCGQRHQPDRLHTWVCSLDPHHGGDHEGDPVRWPTGPKPGRRSWSR